MVMTMLQGIFVTFKWMMVLMGKKEIDRVDFRTTLSDLSTVKIIFVLSLLVKFQTYGWQKILPVAAIFSLGWRQVSCRTFSLPSHLILAFLYSEF